MIKWMTKQQEIKHLKTKILDLVIQQARLREFGAYIDDKGCINHLSGNDPKMHIEGIQIKLEHMARSLLLRMTWEDEETKKEHAVEKEFEERNREKDVDFIEKEFEEASQLAEETYRECLSDSEE